MPVMYGWAVRKVSKIPKEQKRRRAIYIAALIFITTMYAAGPHRKPDVGNRFDVRKWKLWKSWMRFFAFEIVADMKTGDESDLLKEQVVVGISPHGVFPFSLAMAAG